MAGAGAVVQDARVAPPDLRRVVEILVRPRAGQQWGYGSGYLLSGSLVLTSAHVLDGARRAIVRGPGVPEVEAGVVWRPGAVDLALLTLDGATVPGCDVRLADPDFVVGTLPFRAVGFPQFKRFARTSGRTLRDSQQIEGTIPMASNVKSGLLALETDGPPPRAGNDSPWHGMSGAAVFSGPALVGVVTLHRQPEGAATLTAQRIASVADPGLTTDAERADFCRLLGLSTLEIPHIGPMALRGTQPLLRGRFASLLERHRLFGGRQAQLDRLTALVDERRSGYTFVTGPSGFGKTALLANWVMEAELGRRPAYHFISRVDGTADETFTLRNLCQQIQAVRRIEDPLPDSAPDLRALYVSLLQPPAEEPLVVVLDGLDEAEGWMPGPDLFPPLGDRVVVVFSAREMADRDWLAELQPPGVVTLELGRLGAVEIEHLLQHAGPGARAFVEHPEALRTVIAKSEGEPYYLRLLVADIAAGRLRSPGQVTGWPQGLRGYFDSWWEQIDCNDEGNVRELLGYLLVAQGPLTRDDLVDIDLDDTLDRRSIGRTIDLAERHVIGDAERGYQLAHPRFGEYLARWQLDEAETAAARERLVEYCGRWRKNDSGYAMRWYTAHLADLGRTDELLALLEDPDWYGAQIGSDPSGAGYIEDIRRCWTIARARSGADAAAGEPSQWLRWEAWCALATTTMHSRISSIPPELLRHLARSGRWAADSLLAAVAHMPDPSERSAALVAIAPELPADALGEALQLARGLPLELPQRSPPRLLALSAIASQMAGPLRDEVVAELFAYGDVTTERAAWLRLIAEQALAGIGSVEQLRVAIVVAAGTGWFSDQHEQLLSAVLEIAGEGELLALVAGSPDAGFRAEATAAVADLLTAGGVAEAFRVARALDADALDGGSPRARALGALAGRLSAEQAATAGRSLAEISHPGWRAWAGARLAARVPGSAARDAVLSAADLENPVWRFWALADALGLLEERVRSAAADAALAVLREAPHMRAQELEFLAEWLTPSQAENGLALLDDEQPPLSAATALAERLVGPRREDVAHELIGALARSDTDRARRADLFVRLLGLLGPESADRELAKELERLDGQPRGGWGLASLAAQVGDAHYAAVRAAAVRSRRDETSIEVFTALLSRAPAEDREVLLDLAIEAASAVELRGYDDAAARAQALTTLIEPAPEARKGELIDLALAAAQAIDDHVLCVAAEATFLGVLPEAAQEDVLRRVGALGDPRARAHPGRDARSARRHGRFERDPLRAGAATAPRG